MAFTAGHRLVYVSQRRNSGFTPQKRLYCERGKGRGACHCCAASGRDPKQSQCLVSDDRARWCQKETTTGGYSSTGQDRLVDDEVRGHCTHVLVTGGSTASRGIVARVENWPIDAHRCQEGGVMMDDGTRRC